MNLKNVMVLVFVSSLSAGALAVGFMGPPTAELEQGKWNLGYNYTYSDMDLDKTTLEIKELISGVEVEGPGSAIVGIEKFKTQRHYFNIGYGLTNTWEIYAQLGLSDVKADMTNGGDSIGYNFDTDFAWGWGTRVTLVEQETVKWGISAQMNWLDTKEEISGTETILGTPIPYKLINEIDSYDLLIAFGPTVDMGWGKLYGGPFYYMFDGDLDITAKAAGMQLARLSADLEEDSNFGGFIGAKFDLTENMDLTTEFSATGDGWAVGGGIAWKF